METRRKRSEFDLFHVDQHASDLRRDGVNEIDLNSIK